MEPIVILSLLVVWNVYNIIATFGNKRIFPYNYVISFIFLLGYGYFYWIGGRTSEAYDIYEYALIGVVVLSLIGSNIRFVFQKERTEFDFKSIEKELEDVKFSSEMLRQRFISTIEILHDGLAFRDDDGSVFATDKYIQIMGLKSNSFTAKDLEKKMYRDDIPQYKERLAKLSKKHPIYSMDYRIVRDNNNVWIKEVGKLIELDNQTTIVSLIKTLDIKQFPETEIDVLNSMLGYKKMYQEMQRLLRTKIPFQLVMIELSNIPKINEKYGRDVGDLMMGEYLKKLRYNFIKNSKSIFRVTGIQFGLIITDQKKYEVLERALTGSGELLNLKMVFGGITQTLFPNIGIAEAPYEGKNVDLVMEQATEALRIAKNRDDQKNYAIYDNL